MSCRSRGSACPYRRRFRGRAGSALEHRRDRVGSVAPLGGCGAWETERSGSNRDFSVREGTAHTTRPRGGDDGNRGCNRQRSEPDSFGFRFLTDYAGITDVCLSVPHIVNGKGAEVAVEHPLESRRGGGPPTGRRSHHVHKLMSFYSAAHHRSFQRCCAPVHRRWSLDHCA